MAQEAYRVGKHMIILKLSGGLGNQMFQYATGFAIAQENNTSLSLDANSYPDPFGRNYSLDVFGIKNESVSKLTSGLFVPFRKWMTLRQINQSKIWNYTYVKESKDAAIKSIKLNRILYLDGYWQNEKYFKKYRDNLIKVYSFPPITKKENEEVLKKIDSSNSISLHIRRGDYTTNSAVAQRFAECTIEYYKRAIEYIYSIVSDPIFFLFSNDIEWVQNHFSIIQTNSIIVDYNQRDDFFNDMHLMSLCNHNIIANSTFSWWGAWLNKHNDKIVIAPGEWYKDPTLNETKNIIPESWVKI